MTPSAVLARLVKGGLVHLPDLTLGPYQTATGDAQGYAALDKQGSLLHLGPTPFALFYWWRTGRAEAEGLEAWARREREQRDFLEAVHAYTKKRRPLQ